MVKEIDLPDFIVIGPGRSGSTWLYKSLDAHPEICMAKNTKETCFFDKNYNKGLEWYSNFFRYCNEGSIKGEVSNLYIYNSKVPKRINKHMPNVKLIACLRDPIDRIRSVYQYRKRNDFITEGFNQAIDKYPDMISDNYYWKHIQAYRGYFSDEQIKILFFQDLKSNPNAFLKELYSFLEVNSFFQPEFMDQKINASADVRIPFMGGILRKMAKLLREFGMHSVLNFLKWNPLLRKIFLKEHTKDEKKNIISNSTQQDLSSVFEEDIQNVMNYTGRDLNDWLR